jgi:hypothetical protein
MTEPVPRLIREKEIRVNHRLLPESFNNHLGAIVQVGGSRYAVPFSYRVMATFEETMAERARVKNMSTEAKKEKYITDTNATAEDRSREGLFLMQSLSNARKDAIAESIKIQRTVGCNEAFACNLTAFAKLQLRQLQVSMVSNSIGNEYGFNVLNLSDAKRSRERTSSGKKRASSIATSTNGDDDGDDEVSVTSYDRTPQPYRHRMFERPRMLLRSGRTVSFDEPSLNSGSGGLTDTLNDLLHVTSNTSKKSTKKSRTKAQ